MTRSPSIVDQLREGPVLGDGGYLIELERRGYVASGTDQEQVGTGRGSGQFTPEVAITNPEALRSLHQEFLKAGSQVLQALTFFATREKLTRAGYGRETERINEAAVRIARDTAGDQARVAGTISRTQLFERDGPTAAAHARDLFAEQLRLLESAGVDFLIVETFFRLDEALIALKCARRTSLPILATMSFRPVTTQSSDGKSVAECAQALVDEGAHIVGTNCEQEPRRMLEVLRRMRDAVDVPIAGQPAAFRTSDACPCFTRMPEFPNDLESIQLPRREFTRFVRTARSEGVGYIGGCCGCNAAYVRAMRNGLS